LELRDLLAPHRNFFNLNLGIDNPLRRCEFT
jgi:hypothetical protein